MNINGGIMRILALIIMLVFAVDAHAVSLTKEQADNLWLLHKEVKKTYPNFKGFNGPYYAPDAIGCTDAEAQAIINASDIATLKSNDDDRKARKKVRNKLKALGLDNDDLKNMGLTNDISD